MATERYLPLFAADLTTACSYHDSISGSLRNRFREDVRSTIKAVIERPESFGRIGGEFRGALIARFPHVIVFTVDGGIPSIFGLRHAASDRNDWFSRTCQQRAANQAMHRSRRVEFIEVVRSFAAAT